MRTRTRAVVGAAAAVATTLTALLAGGLPAHAAGIVCGQMPTGEEATAPPPGWVADLNTQRVAAGLRPVTYAPDLDEFARVHAVELLANPTKYSNPHFACAGDEVIGGGKDVAQAAQGLLSVPAHGDWLLAPGLKSVGGAVVSTLGIIYGTWWGQRVEAPDYQFPKGATELRRMVGPEWPNPLEHCPGQDFLHTGTPMWARFPVDPVGITATSLTDTTTGANVPLCSFIWTTTSAVPGWKVTPYTITMMPTEPLRAGHTYQATATSSAAGSRTWSFTIAPRSASIKLDVSKVSARTGTASVRVAVADTSEVGRHEGAALDGTVTIGKLNGATCVPLHTQVLDGTTNSSPTLVHQNLPVTGTETICATLSGRGIVGGPLTPPPVTVTNPAGPVTPPSAPFPDPTPPEVPADDPPPFLAKPSKITVTAVTPRGTVKLGAKVAVSGKLTGPPSGATVVLEQRYTGANTFTKVASGKAAAGSFRLTFPVRHSGQLRVRYAGSSSVKPATTYTYTLKVRK